eukprot:TRINITY_DN20536_c0_g1_i1.p1 TRINITY_DN20536_c0_g1~~TRINITY_DN20536_c0_g1_i1.p1  ORF type:complete len:200 (+),score=17.10 TRINITY_DN20536_c0_g1_i1:69-668(+)
MSALQLVSSPHHDTLLSPTSSPKALLVYKTQLCKFILSKKKKRTKEKTFDKERGWCERVLGGGGKDRDRYLGFKSMQKEEIPERVEVRHTPVVLPVLPNLRDTEIATMPSTAKRAARRWAGLVDILPEREPFDPAIESTIVFETKTGYPSPFKHRAHPPLTLSSFGPPTRYPKPPARPRKKKHTTASRKTKVEAGLTIL